MIYIEATLKPGDYLFEETDESNKLYYLIFDVTEDSITLIPFKGTPYNSNTSFPFDKANDFSAVVLSTKDYITEVVTESYTHNNLDCKRITAIKYIYQDKSLIMNIPNRYYNGTQYIDVSEDSD